MRYRANVETLERLKFLMDAWGGKASREYERECSREWEGFGSVQRGQYLDHFTVSCLYFQENSPTVTWQEEMYNAIISFDSFVYTCAHMHTHMPGYSSSRIYATTSCEGDWTIFKSWFSPSSNMGFGDETQITRLGSKHLFLRSHLPAPKVVILI